MAIAKRKLSQKNPELTIDLTKLFGQRIPNSDTFKEGVGQAIIDAMRARSKKGIDINGQSFRKYSDRYVKSLDFKAAGKSRGSVNMKLTGDMLGFMDVISTSRNTITIGWDDREDQLKAHGHITGSPAGPGVRRDFFGLPEDEYRKLASKFTLPREVPARDERGALSTLTTLRELFLGQTSS